MKGSIREYIVLGTLGGTAFGNPMRMDNDASMLYIADSLGKDIKAYGGEGSQTSSWTSSSNLQMPTSLAIDNNSFYITDSTRGEVIEYSRVYRSYKRIAVERGNSDGKLLFPVDIKLYKDRFYVSDSSKALISVYDKNFTFLYNIGRGKGGVTLSSSKGIDVSDDLLYVADSVNNRIVVFTLDGFPIDVLDSNTLWGNFTNPEDIAVGDGKLYVADTGNKIVKVFTVNNTVKDQSVLDKIKSANESIKKLLALQSAADKLKITYTISPAYAHFVDAQKSYDAYDFGGADTLISQAITESSTAQSSLSFNVGIKIRQIAKNEQDRLISFRNAANNEQLNELSKIDKIISQSLASLSVLSYESAADNILKVPKLVDDYIAKAKKDEQINTELEENESQMQYENLMNDLIIKISKAEKRLAEYHQSYDFSNAKSLIKKANESIQKKDYDSANRSLTLAKIELDSYVTSFEVIMPDIDSALANISVFEIELKSTIAKPVLIPTDFSLEKSQILQAKAAAYANPALAVVIARQASFSAREKMDNAQKLSSTLSAFAIIIGAMGIIVVGIFLYLKGRKKPKKKEEDEKKGLEKLCS